MFVTAGLSGIQWQAFVARCRNSDSELQNGLPQRAYPFDPIQPVIAAVTSGSRPAKK